MWTDESLFPVFNPRRGRVWRTSGQKYHREFLIPQIQGGGGKVMVWGCMTVDGVGPLVQLKGKVNSTAYLQVVRNTLIPAFAAFRQHRPHAVLQQDNNPIHKAKKVQAEFKTAKIPLFPWPGRSPDLSPIETLWDILDDRVRAQHSPPQNEKKLWKLLKEEWGKVSTKECRTLIESVSKRVQECTRNHGWQTKY